MGHRVVGLVAVGVGRAKGPAYRVAVGLEPRAIAVSKLVEGPSVSPGHQLFRWINWKVAMSTLLGA